MNVGLLLIATGKYDRFIGPLIESARSYFMPAESITYFLFTDSEEVIHGDDVVVTYQQHRPFPYPTLMRYEIFYRNKALFDNCDYLFYCDADMLFAAEVSHKILAQRVATIHPGFLGGRGTPETRPESLACVYPHENMVYHAGGFNGGSRDEFIKMAQVLCKNIQTDLDNGIVAIWHDESHMNRYFIDNPPEIVLSPAYCYPEGWDLPFEKKLIALNKNHAELRK